MLLLAVAAIVLVGIVAWPTTSKETQAIIAKRQDIMKLNIQFMMRAMIAVVRNDVENVQQSARGLSASAAQFDNLWPPGSVSGDSSASPEIWKNGADFTRKLSAFKNSTEEMLRVAQAENLDAFRKYLVDVGEAYTDCHAAYRLRRK